MKYAAKQGVWLLSALLVLAGCGSADDDAAAPADWADTEVTFVAGGLTIHGSYRTGAEVGPAALLISESGPTDRNGDNTVVGPVNNMRQFADLLTGHDVASLRYDKVGTGETGLGPYADRPQDVGSAIYTTGAQAALRFLAEQPTTDPDRLSVYGHGEGAIHALTLAGAADPPLEAVGLLQPLLGRYLDIVTERVRTDGTPETLAVWLAAVEQVRAHGTAPAELPDGLGAILNPDNVNAVVEADRIDPVALAADVPAGTAVMLTCSDSDRQADCGAAQPLIDALDHTDLQIVELRGVNHVLRDDYTDDATNYAQQSPLSPQLVNDLTLFLRR